MGFFGDVLHSGGNRLISPLTHSHILIFPCGTNHGPEGSLLALSCVTLGEPSPLHPDLYFFLL